MVRFSCAATRRPIAVSALTLATLFARPAWADAMPAEPASLYPADAVGEGSVSGGYALSRSSFKYVFWLLIIALIFRAIPPITLVSGYLPVFFQYNVWGFLPTAIIVLVAINQPFTLWMLHSFFESIPKELDESAKVDGCTQFQAFRRVIIPVMWPGVITTGLFSFLLAYNDFSVTSMLLSEENRTMVPAIYGFLGSTQEEGNVMFAVASVVSATAPLFVLVMFFQRQIVSGLTAGAVKG